MQNWPHTGLSKTAQWNAIFLGAIINLIRYSDRNSKKNSGKRLSWSKTPRNTCESIVLNVPFSLLIPKLRKTIIYKNGSCFCVRICRHSIEMIKRKYRNSISNNFTGFCEYKIWQCPLIENVRGFQEVIPKEEDSAPVKMQLLPGV